jgi:hypothetical protein
MDFVHRPELKINRKHNVSEIGSVSIFRLGEGDTPSGPLDKVHWGELFLKDPTEVSLPYPEDRSIQFPKRRAFCLFKKPHDGQNP